MKRLGYLTVAAVVGMGAVLSCQSVRAAGAPASPGIALAVEQGAATMANGGPPLLVLVGGHGGGGGGGGGHGGGHGGGFGGGHSFGGGGHHGGFSGHGGFSAHGRSFGGGHAFSGGHSHRNFGHAGSGWSRGHFGRHHHRHHGRHYYYGYGGNSCYQYCRYYHGPHYCSRFWMNYCSSF
jgi:hypothetical protein